MLIIVKGSGHDARKRVVRHQKDLINVVNKYVDNHDRTKNAIKDFEIMSKDSGLFNRKDEKGLRHIATFEPKKEGEKYGVQEKTS